jgi:YfiH family protein
MSFFEQNRNGVTCLKSSLLEELNVPHGFSTRMGGVSQGIFASLNLGHTRGDDPERVVENYRRFCAATETDAEKLVFSHQVHKADVRACTLADAGKGLYRERDYEADGLCTDVPGLPLVIFSADCIPVLLCDPVRQVVAACHCGWRGTALGMARNTVAAMVSRYGCDPVSIRAAIGPGISRCCFETTEDVPEAMLASYGESAQAAIDTLEGGKFKVDLKALVALDLERAGVPREQIDISPACTCCHPERFWSHRKVGNQRGSLAAVIQLPKNS